MNVPVGRYVDVAFALKNPCAWMLYCHIINHEDGGLATMVMVG